MKRYSQTELFQYGKKFAESSASTLTDGHPGTGRSAKRLDDGACLISDVYSVILVKKTGDKYHYRILRNKFKEEA